jgi:hypothetical protein
MIDALTRIAPPPLPVPRPAFFLTGNQYPPSTVFPASSPGSTDPGRRFEAKNNKTDDFIHSETSKMDVTHLSSTNLPQNSPRFFAIFVDFCAQNGPFFSPVCPSATPLGDAGRWWRKRAHRRLAATPPFIPVQLGLTLRATLPEMLEPNTPPLPQTSIDTCFCETVKL